MPGFNTLADVVGFVVMAIVIALIGALVGTTRLPRSLKSLIYAALALRVFGGWCRFAIMDVFYGGIGDASGYYERGLGYAQYFRAFDFSPFFDPALWFRGSWTGTSFISYPSGIVLAFIGPSMVGEFVAFSLMAFIGLVGFAVAFQRANPGMPVQPYARWIWMFPSLWYWPSSAGKEAVILMGLGLAVCGFIGKRGRVNWVLLAAGFFLAFAVRPQVAAVLAGSCVVAYWLSLGQRWTFGKAVQGLLIAGVGLVGLRYAMTYMGVQSFDVDGVQAYMEAESEGAATDGTSVGAVQVGFAGIPMAFFNILFRPFPWDVRNIPGLMASFEITAFWVLVWTRRHNFMRALRGWRSHPLTRLAVPFILVYSVSLGMLVVNLGIITRQRIFLFPFLFFFLEVAPAVARRRPARRMARVPQRYPPRYVHPAGRLNGA
jgi:hypothetical protein